MKTDIQRNDPHVDWSYVTPYDYGCYGDGIQDDTTNFAAAVTAAGTRGTLLLPYGTFILSSNVTIPSTVEVVFRGNAKLSIQTGVTVTINGPVVAPDHTIFTLTGTGTATFASNPYVGILEAAWWGVIGDGSTDCTTVLANAITAAVNKTLRLPGGSIVTSTVLTIPTSIHIIGAGTGGSFSTTLRPNNCAAFLCSGIHHSLIENVMIWPSGATQPANLITIENISYSLKFRHIRIHYDINQVPTSAVILQQANGGENNDIVWENLVMRTEGATGFPIGMHFANGCGSAMLIDPDIEVADRGIKWEGGQITIVGIRTETCGVHSIHMEPSSDSTAGLTLYGGVLLAPSTAVALGIKAGSKNVRVHGTWITPPASGYQAYVYDLTGSANIDIALSNMDATKIGGAVSFNPAIIRFSGANRPLPASKFTSINVTVGTLAAGDITGAQFVSLMSTNATPGTQTTRTAAQMFADITNALPGDTYVLRITNTGAGTLTLGAGTNVTLTGTMTVAQNTFRDFVVTITSATAITIQSIGIGTYS